MKKKLILAMFLSLFSLNALADENEKNQALEDQIDINTSNIEKLSDKIDKIDNNLNFKLFGSVAFRNCSMSSNILSEPQNIIKNALGSVFQTRISLGLKGNITENTDYQFRFLTNPGNSYNLSWSQVGTELVKLPFTLDRVFVSHNFKDGFNNNINFTLGKANNFFAETELFFDEDVSFSGLSQSYKINDLNSVVKNVSLSLAENFVGIDGPFNNVFMLGGKASSNLEFTKDLNLDLGGSYISFVGGKKFANESYKKMFTWVIEKTNRVGSDKLLESDYNLLDLYAKLNFNLFDIKHTLFVDFVNNLGAKDKNKGFSVGFDIGEQKKQGDLMFSYNYKMLEQDYNYSSLIQEQMLGTDTVGHNFELSYKFLPKTNVVFTLQNATSLSEANKPHFYILYTSIRQDL
ncbi:MAG: putative porin [Candidatus Sericytochromatia bacterium]